MNKIKTIIVLVLLISIFLAYISRNISNINSENNLFINKINMQKELIQELSKDILYVYKNNVKFDKRMNDSLKKYSTYIKYKDINENSKIFYLKNKFHNSIIDFRKKNLIYLPYSNLILEKIVKEIYNMDVELVVEFDSKIKKNSVEFTNKIKIYTFIEHLLYFILISLLIYLATQLKELIFFIQRFLNTSENIVNKSSIKELKPMEIVSHNTKISEATENFNTIVNRINSSIEYAGDSMEQSYKSLEIVEKNIENLLDLICKMSQNLDIDKELTKREDAVIQSLEELTNSTYILKTLKNDLDNLLTYNKC